MTTIAAARAGARRVFAPRLTIRPRVALSFAVVVAVLVLVGFSGLLSIARVTRVNQAAELVSSILALSYKSRLAERMYASTDDRSYSVDSAAAIQRARGNVGRLRTLEGASLIGDVARLDKALDRYEAKLLEFWALLDQRSALESTTLMRTKDLVSALDSIKALEAAGRPAADVQEITRLVLVVRLLESGLLSDQDPEALRQAGATLGRIAELGAAIRHRPGGLDLQLAGYRIYMAARDYRDLLSKFDLIPARLREADQAVNELARELEVFAGQADDSARRAVDRTGREASLGFFALLTLALAAAVSLTIYLSAYITRPLSDLVAVTRAIAGGDFTRAAGASSGDEIGALARSVNDMARALRRSTAELEQRVRERTVELSRVNTALAEANARLQELSETDSLTGLANRRKLDQVLDIEWRRAAREGRPICALLMDVDHFKHYNDTYGHAAGDDCLRRVGEALRLEIRRAGEIAARYGGEEFLVLLPFTGSADGVRTAERLRRGIEALAVPHAGAPGPGVVTTSIGVAAFEVKGAEAPATLLDAADRALYAAKNAGRNRVEVVAGRETA